MSLYEDLMTTLIRNTFTFTVKFILTFEKICERTFNTRETTEQKIQNSHHENYHCCGNFKSCPYLILVPPRKNAGLIHRHLFYDQSGNNHDQRRKP